MSTFSQFLVSVKKSPEPRQITWVCGTEPVLVEEVVNHVVGYLSPEPWNLASMSALEHPEKAIWAAFDQHPLGSSPRVLVIRHADQLTDWGRFISWVKHRRMNPRTYVVMVSDEEKVPRTDPTPQQRREGAKSEPLPHIACIGSKGHVVECRMFTTTTANRAVEWVQSKAPMRSGVAKHLLLRSNWDLRMVRDTCLKLSAFPGEITISVVNALMVEQPGDSFADALLALDRKTAFHAAELIPETDIGRVIGLLDAQVDKAGAVHDMQIAHRPTSEMVKMLGPQSWLLPKLTKIAKHYDPKRRLAIRRVLAIADEAYRGGQKIGVLESVVSFW